MGQEKKHNRENSSDTLADLEENRAKGGEDVARSSTQDHTQFHAATWFAPSPSQTTTNYTDTNHHTASSFSSFDFDNTNHHSTNNFSTAGNYSTNNFSTIGNPSPGRVPGVSSSPQHQPQQQQQQQPVVSVLSELRYRKMRIINLGLHAGSAVFSLVSFIIMASNNNNGNIKVSNVEAYQYVLGMNIVAFFYSLMQAGRWGFELRSEQSVQPEGVACWVDFIGDQMFAYLLMSCSSSGATVTNGLMRQVGVNAFSQMGAGSVSMSFFAFFAMAACAFLSASRLCRMIDL